MPPGEGGARRGSMVTQNGGGGISPAYVAYSRRGGKQQGSCAHLHACSINLSEWGSRREEEVEEQGSR